MEARIEVRRAAPLILGLLIALGACGKGGEKEGAEGNRAATAGPKRSNVGVTPMSERVAVLGILNKRNGIAREVKLHPGQSAKWKDLLVRLRACETTAPWEEERLTGAFVQVDVRNSGSSKLQRIFSGWLYKESPSLNVVEHPVYDVWTKSCEMTYPDGPAAPAAPVSSSNRSSAPKSGGEAPATRAAPPSEPASPPSAVANNAT